MRRFLLMPVIVIIAIPVHIQSAEKTPTALTIPQLVDRGLEQSCLVTAADSSVSRARAERIQAGAWPNPSIGIEGGMKNAEGKTGPLYGITISQDLPFPGRRERRDALAAIEERLAGLERQEAELFVRYTVIRLAARYAAALEMEKHMSERIERFSRMKRYMSGRPFPSPKKRMEKHIVEMRLDLLQRDLVRTRNERNALWNSLNLYTNLDAPVEVSLPLFYRGMPLDGPAIYRSMETGNIDMKKRALLLERIDAETALSRREPAGDLSFSLRYAEERAAGTERSASAGLTMAMPLWNRNDGHIAALEARRRGEQAMVEYARRERSAELSGLIASYDASCRAIEALPPSMLDNIHERMRDADDSFDRDLVDLATYMEVESWTSEIHRAVFDAQADYVENYTAIMALEGRTDCPLFTDSDR